MTKRLTNCVICRDFGISIIFGQRGIFGAETGTGKSPCPLMERASVSVTGVFRIFYFRLRVGALNARSALRGKNAHPAELVALAIKKPGVRIFMVIEMRGMKMARSLLPSFSFQRLAQGTDPETAVVGLDQRTVKGPVLQWAGLVEQDTRLDSWESPILWDPLPVGPIETSVMGTAMAITGALKRPRVPVEIVPSGTRIFE